MPSLPHVSNKELLNLVNVGGRGCRCTSNETTPWTFAQQSTIDRSLLIDRSHFVTPADAPSLLNSNALSTSSTYESDYDSELKSPADNRIEKTDTTTYLQLKKNLISMPTWIRWHTATTPSTHNQMRLSTSPLLL
jgi:hypothetical protein